MRSWFLAVPALALSLPAGSTAFSQPPAAPPATPAPTPAAPAADLPTGESLFEKHVAALGGLEALKSQKTAMIKGRIVRQGAPTGLLTLWRKAPDKMYKILDFPGSVTIETWCDGDSAWIRNSNKGAVRLSGEALDETRLESQFIGEADYKARYKELKTKEKTTFGERPAYAVAATTTAGKQRTLYFDAEKGFLIGVGLTVPLADGKEQVVTITLGEYKKFGVTWQPTAIVEDAGHIKTITTFSQIEMDLAAMPSIEPPDEIKSLKK